MNNSNEPKWADSVTKPPDLSNYDVTITPLAAGHSWLVKYTAIAKLFIYPDTNELVLMTRADISW